MTLGIALGSGGARGWCHIGALSALKAKGIEPDVVAGCSMGALVGAAWAGGKLDKLESWARDLTRVQFLRYVDLRLRGGGLVQGQAVRDIMEELDLPERIEDLDRPFIAVATDMSNGREVWLQEGSLFDAVRASISIPGVLCPHKVDSHWLLDGGMTNPVPTSACRALGARRTIAVNPNGKADGYLWRPDASEPFWHRVGAPSLVESLPQPMKDLLPGSEAANVTPQYVDVVSTSIDIMTEFVRKVRRATDPADVLLDADLTNMSVLELFRAEEAINEGRRIVEDCETLGRIKS